MLSVEELFSFSYMLVSSVSLLHQLRGHSLVTVVSRDTAWIFCLEDKQERGLSSTRYVLNGEAVASRCNRQGASVLLQFVVFLLTSFELLIFCVAVYAHRLTIRRRIVVVGEKLLCQLTGTLVTITGILMTVLLVLPLAQYYVFVNTTDYDGSAQAGLFDKIFRSPWGIFFSFLIFIVTAPLQSILQGQYNIELELDKIHANFTCVDPTVDRVTNVYRCPAELSRGSGYVPEPSACKETFDCVHDCDVVFPNIVMSSLCVILASFALGYRILNLRHNTTLTLHGGAESTVLKGQAEAAADLEVRFSTVANRRSRDGCGEGPKSTPSNALGFSTTKDTVAAGRSTEPAGSSDCERQSCVELKLLHANQFEGRESERNRGNAVEDLRQHNGNPDRASTRNNDSQQYAECWRGNELKNGERTLRLSENGLVKRGKGRRVFRDETLERLEELGCSSSSGEGDAVFMVVEDETEYYIAGFRL